MAHTTQSADGTDLPTTPPAGATVTETDAGALVFVPVEDGIGQRLAGFGIEADLDAMADELARRGLSRGAVHHKPRFHL